MHNNIMSAGSRDRPPMLATGRYAQWRSCFLRYIDIRPNCYALRKCILEGPYTPSTVIILVVPVIENSLAVPERTTVETILNVSLENKAHFKSEKEVIHLLLTGIGDEIYLTVDACKTAHEMWEAIERLQQGESLNIQDVKTNLFGSLENSPLMIERQWSHTTQGKEIAKPITPPSESSSEEDSDPEQAQKDKEMQQNLALIAKYFKKIYKPTNNNLRTSSNTRKKNMDTTPSSASYIVSTGRRINVMAEQDIPPPTITAMKIPIIRKGVYDIWSMRMRQYIFHTYHNLWDVIVNGDLEEEHAPTTGETTAPPAPKTAKQLAARRNQERVKSILLLAIPDEYLLKFHNVADAKSL
ncbi:hypothetical protein Tco_0800298 [Tanacetum coccineum]|uniref:Uncharacterized protein n=1 Tax=Tanacetum coccineum TaxID=301880 RepID=A0ABQ4ZSQ2_9ASTR